MQIEPRFCKTSRLRKHKLSSIFCSYLHDLRHHRNDANLCDICYHYLYTRECWKYSWLGIRRIHWCSYYNENQLTKAYHCIRFHSDFNPKTCIACYMEGGGGD